MQARLTREQAPVAAAADGARLFDTAGCSACHRIAGTGANGLAGPDLTFVGARRTLGAGILPNNRGTLMGWIGNSQAIKPNNRMPPYTVLTAEQLRILVVYLEAQKRSEEHTSELQSLMRITYAVFCLKQKTSIYIAITKEKLVRH